MLALAEREGIDLASSYAYSDSATDEPMLAVVGHPVAVNPDRELLRIAREREWEVRYFVRPGAAARPAAQPAGSPDRRGGRRAGGGDRRRRHVVDAAPHAAPHPPRRRRAAAVQAARTFLAATVPRAMSTMRRSSFFMDRQPTRPGRPSASPLGWRRNTQR